AQLKLVTHSGFDLDPAWSVPSDHEHAVHNLGIAINEQFQGLFAIEQQDPPLSGFFGSQDIALGLLSPRLGSGKKKENHHNNGAYQHILERKRSEAAVKQNSFHIEKLTNAFAIEKSIFLIWADEGDQLVLDPGAFWVFDQKSLPCEKLNKERLKWF